MDSCFLVIYLEKVALTESSYRDENGFALVEELRQEFFETYPELTKSPQSNPIFSTDKRYLNEVCAKYNLKTSEDKSLVEARSKIQGTTETMRNNVVFMMANRTEADVMLCLTFSNWKRIQVTLLITQGHLMRLHSRWQVSIGGDR